ncbi:MAG: universal stress protein [Methanoregulaceae archaeon]
MTGLFRKILVATDGSENNRTAVSEAVRIAAADGSNLYAVYVIDTTVFESASTDAPVTDLYRVLRKEAQESLDKVKTLAGGVPVETVILEGKPAGEIVRFAEKNGIDLIVLGTRGKSGIERLLLGSVADKVIRTAGTRVLIVKK